MKKKPAIGHIYGAMDRAKEVIMKSFNEKEEKYMEVLIIDENANFIDFCMQRDII